MLRTWPSLIQQTLEPYVTSSSVIVSKFDIFFRWIMTGVRLIFFLGWIYTRRLWMTSIVYWEKSVLLPLSWLSPENTASYIVWSYLILKVRLQCDEIRFGNRMTNTQCTFGDVSENSYHQFEIVLKQNILHPVFWVKLTILTFWAPIGLSIIYSRGHSIKLSLMSELFD